MTTAGCRPPIAPPRGVVSAGSCWRSSVSWPSTRSLERQGTQRQSILRLRIFVSLSLPDPDPEGTGFLATLFSSTALYPTARARFRQPIFARNVEKNHNPCTGGGLERPKRTTQIHTGPPTSGRGYGSTSAVTRGRSLVAACRNPRGPLRGFPGGIITRRAALYSSHAAEGLVSGVCGIRASRRPQPLLLGGLRAAGPPCRCCLEVLPAAGPVRL